MTNRIDQRTDFDGKLLFTIPIHQVHVRRLHHRADNRIFCPIFKILLFSNGNESNQIENKMHNLVQKYAHHTSYYA